MPNDHANLRKKKHGHDRLKPENQLIKPKAPPLFVSLDHRFGVKGPAPTPQALVSL